MKLSEAWLREWVKPNLSTDELVAQITMAGLEVDAVEAVAGNFNGVVVGEILSVEPHPDADKLRVCQVAGDSEGVRQVVCGAPNARAGIKIPFALVGAQLPGDFKIKKAKLRGVESLGMLCAQTELQAGDDDDGLWELPADAPVGTDLRDYLQLNDQIIEVDLTPNRSDCLSIKGLAREVAVLNRCEVTPPAIAPVPVTAAESLPVVLNAPEACSRYVGRVIRNIDISRPSPLWLQEKLRRSGLRPIDAVVDVTNYVLLELGQPMHAFDLAKLEGGIDVRMAEQGEQVVLLDGQELTLNADTLVIADAKQALAVAGIMGGKHSAVTGATQNILLESAFFHPLAIAGRARSYGLHTDSSHRFERGVDYQLQLDAMERATVLLLEIVGGEAGPLVEAKNDEHLPQARQVTLRRGRISAALGLEIADEDIEAMLLGLGLTLEERRPDAWVFGVPSYRFDLALEVDLLEELARIYGYNRLPTRSLAAPLPVPAHAERQLGLPALRRQLVARGYQEAVTYSFIEPELNRQFDPDNDPVTLKNPISADMGAMRTSLLPGLVKTLQHNLNRQQERVRLFESGLRFILRGDELEQEPMLAGLIYGNRQPEEWANSQDPADFYDIKGDLEALLAMTGAEGEFRFQAASHPALHPGQCAAVYRGDRLAGFVGAVHPQLQQALDIPRPVYVFEVAQWALLEARLPAFKPLSRFPAIRRDLALLLARETAADQVLKCVEKHAGEHLIDLKVFDLYMGKGIDPHRKSVALGLTFQHPSRTLTEDEINAAVDLVVQHLQSDFDATLR
ncbi:phenylalanine--tRNA ligase subunit beta [Marinimicrobium sp. ABcell2]|uniref:phenylalanine--tRNA ligase subunit beta n=1 Tax=Marinimicrobium sp. ABcell2 TaxID=3069751 RepID=UPI0027AF79C0|nr:phenylalanine--tRNA ligase subunit beta [Marinimicrobium sp. ABcell2]MDQ2077290.1 phenylalanine--tRNA ligase subunit beta [Marinimicrobium sp. ABcell2]